MSGAPNQRRMTSAEMGYTAVEAGKRAERRAALLERRIAMAEDRMAEQDRTISELASGLQDASDTISAFHVVLKELQEQTGKGVDAVLTGLDSRLAQLAQDMDAFTTNHEHRLDDLEAHDRKDTLSEDRLSRIQDQLLENAQDREFLAGRIQALEAKPRRGRPLGSKNKPKVQAMSAAGATQAEAKANLQSKIDKASAENGENAVQAGDSSNPEASDG